MADPKITITVQVEETIPASGSSPGLRVRMDNATVELVELGVRGGANKAITLSRRQWAVALSTMNALEAKMAGALESAQRALAEVRHG